jgi:hypothetical protein
MKEALGIDGLDALLAAGRRLLELDSDAFAKVLAAARALVSVYERPEETDEIFASRISQIRPRGPRSFD